MWQVGMIKLPASSVEAWDQGSAALHGARTAVQVGYEEKTQAAVPDEYDEESFEIY